MFRDVVHSNTSPEEWPGLRRELHNRILHSMGDPAQLEDAADMKVLEAPCRDGLRFESFRFNTLPGRATYGTLILPEVDEGSPTRPAVMCMHGTDPVRAHRNVLSPDEKPNRAYAIELAKRGFVTLAVDQLAHGDGNAGQPQDDVIASFYKEYPEWSLDGIRLSIHQRAIDLLAAHPMVDASRLGCIGHSLGGRTAVYLAAFDERIKAAVPSAGVSPNISNVFRNPPGRTSLSPRLDDAMARSGHALFEYQEILALVAPRAALLVEPWNDTCNPHIEPVFRCFEKTRFVFELLGVPENLQILCHGDGHDTTLRVRNYAYAWLEDKLRERMP